MSEPSQYEDTYWAEKLANLRNERIAAGHNKREQRRYEIARDVLAHTIWATNYSASDRAAAAIKYADALLTALDDAGKKEEGQ